MAGTWFTWRQEVNIGNRKAILKGNGHIIFSKYCTPGQLVEIQKEFYQYDCLREMNR